MNVSRESFVSTGIEYTLPVCASTKSIDITPLPSLVIIVIFQYNVLFIIKGIGSANWNLSQSYLGWAFCIYDVISEYY